MRLEAHLSFPGTCAEAFAFYQSILGGEITAMFRYGDAPGDMQGDPATKDYVMHAYLQIGDAAIMGADAPPQFQSKPQGFCVNIQAADVAEAQRIWGGLSEGAKAIQMPLAPTFWSPMFGMLIDKYDQPWMVNTTPDEAFIAANAPK
ncbi:VOC family protein [Asticcacaulis sp. YBE204]|uniref:VOC family protein n=1 Tax=Asticcacaulis sp. YBE204 TaxID=1282363 RepID=UPI0003C40BAF|nr:VOC family protein [Asticcacaulis sp. YBE204]ESQ81039.1 hypothetical protein AEYBE204_01555 [Asticcacaulis sp. YBE204]